MHSQYSEWIVSWKTEEKWFNSQQGQQVFFFFFFFSKMSQLVLELAQPHIQWIQMAPSLGIKWPRHEAAHSPPSSAKVRSAWSYTSTPPCAFMACRGTILPFSMHSFHHTKHTDERNTVINQFITLVHRTNIHHCR